jgi:hypothetical protein
LPRKYAAELSGTLILGWIVTRPSRAVLFCHQMAATFTVIPALGSFTYSPRDPHTWRNPETEDAVVLWFAVPNPYVV